ncbi:MAG: helix-turn-helix domain-containing protein [Nitrospira sp.]|nr:helix-turn-helix domain-containing protein [Nitrospira sp.]
MQQEEEGLKRLSAGVALKFSLGFADIVCSMNEVGSTSMEQQMTDVSEAHGEILTVMDVASFLRVPKSTVYKLARIGELPASKIGKHWRFLRRDVQEWFRARSQQN